MRRMKKSCRIRCSECSELFPSSEINVVKVKGAWGRNCFDYNESDDMAPVCKGCQDNMSWCSHCGSFCSHYIDYAYVPGFDSGFCRSCRELLECQRKECPEYDDSILHNCKKCRGERDYFIECEKAKMEFPAAEALEGAGE